MLGHWVSPNSTAASKAGMAVAHPYTIFSPPFDRSETVSLCVLRGSSDPNEMPDDGFPICLVDVDAFAQDLHVTMSKVSDDRPQAFCIKLTT